jgi:hypothetical protein
MDIWLYKRIIKIQKSLNRIENLITIMNDREVIMAGELEKLVVEVAETEGMVDSAITLIVGLSDYIKLHANDPVAMLALANSLDAKQATLAAAIAANPVPPTV